MGAQQVGAMLFFDKLPDLLVYRERQNQLLEPPPGRTFKNRILTRLATGGPGCGLRAAGGVTATVLSALCRRSARMW
jgi:hypothetical protein